jgi:hypothetical protein
MIDPGMRPCTVVTSLDAKESMHGEPVRGPEWVIARRLLRSAAQATAKRVVVELGILCELFPEHRDAEPLRFGRHQPAEHEVRALVARTLADVAQPCCRFMIDECVRAYARLG